MSTSRHLPRSVHICAFSLLIFLAAGMRSRFRRGEEACDMREGRGNGQLILFADDPAFGGMYAGTGKQLLYALFLGPGWGSARKVER